MGRRFDVTARAALLGVMFVSLAGCKTAPARGPGAVEVVAGTAAGSDTSYRLQPGDNIVVHFFSYPDLDDTTVVGPDGHVSLRLISDFPIAGMTLAEASTETNDRYANVLRHPGITIEIKTYALQQIYVAGEVNSPGVIRSTIPLTASGAIAQAGGIKLATGHAHGALLLRRNADGAVVYYKLNFNGDLPGGMGDPILRTNDMVYVPRTAIAAVADFVQSNLARIIPFSATYSVYHNY
jgi:polysaccharide export outer membrane protein